MTILTPNEIGTLIYLDGGWGPGGGKDAVIKWLDTAIAVAHGESGWDTHAVNGHSSAAGLYQIMTTVHADKVKDAIKRWEAETGKNDLTIFDPRVNIDVARMVSQEAKAAGHDEWSPWEAYTNKTAAYKAGLGHGKSVYEFLNSPANIEKMRKKLEADVLTAHNYADYAAVAAPGAPLIQGVEKITNSDLVSGVLSFVRQGTMSIGEIGRAHV